jgi:hypothetical protein
MLDSLRGEGALASLDSLPRTFAGMNEVVKSNALMLVLGQKSHARHEHHQACIMDASESVVAPDTDREREAGEGRPAG